MGLKPTSLAWKAKAQSLYHIRVRSGFSLIAFPTARKSCIFNDLEREAGIEPALSPWQGDRLPLQHTRKKQSFRRLPNLS